MARPRANGAAVSVLLFLLFTFSDVDHGHVSGCPDAADEDGDASSAVPYVPDPLDVRFYYRTTFTVIGVSWVGQSDDVRAGLNWYVVQKNGTELLVGRMDWQGYHHLKEQYSRGGAVFMYYGPPEKGNVSQVYITGWLEAPVGFIGHYRIKGYGLTADARIVGRTYTSVNPNPDKFEAYAYYFNCMRPDGESVCPDKALNLSLQEQIHWWNGGRRIATFTPSGQLGVPGKTDWVEHPDYLNQYLLDPFTGALKVFGTEAIVRLSCLRCTRQGPNYSSLSMLSCRDPDTNTRIPPASGKDLRLTTNNTFLDFLEFGLSVVTWTVVGIALTAALGLLALTIAGAMVSSSCCSRLRACVVDGGRGGTGYRKLPVNEIV